MYFATPLMKSANWLEISGQKVRQSFHVFRRPRRTASWLEMAARSNALDSSSNAKGSSGWSLG